uniref:Uncharacterized protein n=1 Tax=Catagonus wagneri TaxID=51154 RepID=A0A8C3X8S1_9CETA
LRKAMMAHMGRGVVAGPPLVLLPPKQKCSNQTTIVYQFKSASQNSLAAPNPADATTKASGSVLQSTAGLLGTSSTFDISDLHLFFKGMVLSYF